MMHPSVGRFELAYSYSILCFCFFFIGTNSQLLYYSCPNTSTYAPNTTYGANLNFLLSTLSSNATRDDGFYNFTAGSDHDTTVYGLFMCRGDVSTRDCEACVKNARADILQLCPKEKTAIIWYDFCMLRYSDTYMFGRVDQSVRLNMCNAQNSSDPIPVMCTPDLSDSDCRACLDLAIKGLVPVPALGCRTIIPNCNIRYETYPFYNNISTAASAPPSLPAPPPNTSPTPVIDAGNHGSPNSPAEVIIVAIVVPVVGILLFIAVLYYFLRIIRISKNPNTKIQTADLTGISTEDQSLQYDLAIIQAITNDFSLGCKIGKGGYGYVYKAWEQWRDGTPLEILDPVLAKSYKVNEVIQCIHIGLLCVQDVAVERPTMAEVMLMLSSYSSNSWPSPCEPAFYHGGSEGMPKEPELEQPMTINVVSISELYPR
nr:cysteine-rich receptor-like protein kinase 25 [Ipomoea batatas]